MEGKVDPDTTKVEFETDGTPVFTFIKHTAERKQPIYFNFDLN